MFGSVVQAISSQLFVARGIDADASALRTQALPYSTCESHVFLFETVSWLIFPDLIEHIASQNSESHLKPISTIATHNHTLFDLYVSAGADSKSLS